MPKGGFANSGRSATGPITKLQLLSVPLDETTVTDLPRALLFKSAFGWPLRNGRMASL